VDDVIDSLQALHGLGAQKAMRFGDDTSDRSPAQQEKINDAPRKPMEHSNDNDFRSREGRHGRSAHRSTNRTNRLFVIGLRAANLGAARRVGAGSVSPRSTN
jgi:hypothetical protein